MSLEGWMKIVEGKIKESLAAYDDLIEQYMATIIFLCGDKEEDIRKKIKTEYPHVEPYNLARVKELMAMGIDLDSAIQLEKTGLSVETVRSATNVINGGNKQ